MRVVHDGAAALDDVSSAPVDFVIMDVGLPAMNGYEVARKMRLLGGMDNAVLVALTGYGTTEDKQRAISAGFDHHLTKPADVEHLRALLPKSRNDHSAALPE